MESRTSPATTNESLWFRMMIMVVMSRLRTMEFLTIFLTVIGMVRFAALVMLRSRIGERAANEECKRGENCQLGHE